MIPRSLATVAVALDARLSPGTDPDVVVDRVTVDSREAGPGALFFALPGEHGDGHDHLDGALVAGAAAVVSARPFGGAGAVLVDDTWAALAALAGHVRRTVAPEVVAITGSVGKTTTKDLVAAACRPSRETVAAKGSFNNELGVPLTLLDLTMTTRVLVCELGARGVGHIAALTPIVRPDTAVVTAVAGVHLEQFGDLDAVARAKAELVAALGPLGTAVLNLDDPRVAAMANRHPGRTVRYSTAPPPASGQGPDVWAEDVVLDALARPTFRAHTPWGTVQVHVGLSGAHNVGNALAALTAACLSGVTLSAAAAGIAVATVSDGRSHAVAVGDITVLDDAYNANPSSMRAAIAAADVIARGTDGARRRVVAVLGVMAEIGVDHEAEHEALGAHLAVAGVDAVVVVGADAAGIARGARGAGITDVRVVDDRLAAAEALDDLLAPGDVVVVKASRVAALESVAESARRRAAVIDAEGAA